MAFYHNEAPFSWVCAFSRSNQVTLKQLVKGYNYHSQWPDEEVHANSAAQMRLAILRRMG